jgi:hypothetical protein
MRHASRHVMPTGAIEELGKQGGDENSKFEVNARGE